MSLFTREVQVLSDKKNAIELVLASGINYFRRAKCFLETPGSSDANKKEKKIQSYQKRKSKELSGKNEINNIDFASEHPNGSCQLPILCYRTNSSITLSHIAGKVRVLRMCLPDRKIMEADCKAKDAECSYCSKDLCNGAGRFGSIALLFAVPVIVTKMFLF